MTGPVSSEPPAALASLLDVLATVERPGDYVAWGSLESVTPRIDIDGIGPLSFPLHRNQAEQLVAVADRAPYGRGGQTLVDPSVRNVWQIPADKVAVGDRWHKTVGNIALAATEGLGVHDPVRVELYKLLLYDEGSFFVAHRDTEKTDGMFATLVVVLPSVHEGGQLVVHHKDHSTTLSLGQGDLAEVNWAAFYADCVHELLPVTKGYRLALIYNLVRPAGTLRAPDHGSQADCVVEVLEAWSAQPEGWPTKIALALEHHYTPAGLSFADLKGADAGMASVLVEAGRRAGFTVHLAMVSIHESGSAEENHYGRRRRWEPEYDDDNFEVIEVTERSVVVEGFCTPDDEAPGLGPIPIDDDEILPEGALDDEDPDEQHYHEATGNEGASFERTYRRAAVVLWPARRRLAVLGQAEPSSTVPLLEHLADSDPDDARELAKHLLARWVTPTGWEVRGKNLVARVLSVLARLQMADDVERFVRGELLGPGYDGSQNEALLACCSALAPERSAALLSEVVTHTVVGALKGCAALLEPLARDTGLDVAQTVAAAVVARLPSDPALLGPHRWQHPRSKPDFVEAVLRGLWAAGDGALATTAIETLLSWYDTDAALVPAVLALADTATDSWLGWPRLRGAVVEHLTQRVALPLQPPADLARPATWDCTCRDCVDFRAFLDSPTEANWSLKAGKDHRRHIEGQLARVQADVDTATVTRGNPHTLVCTKNQRSYERRVARSGSGISLPSMRWARGRPTVTVTHPRMHPPVRYSGVPRALLAVLLLSSTACPTSPGTTDPTAAPAVQAVALGTPTRAEVDAFVEALLGAFDTADRQTLGNLCDASSIYADVTGAPVEPLSLEDERRINEMLGTAPLGGVVRRFVAGPDRVDRSSRPRQPGSGSGGSDGEGRTGCGRSDPCFGRVVGRTHADDDRPATRSE